MYQLKIKKQARKALEKAPEHIRRKFEDELRQVVLSPRDSKKLQGFEDRYRIRAGDWRAIYEIDDDTITVTVIKVGPRGDVYKS